MTKEEGQQAGPFESDFIEIYVVCDWREDILGVSTSEMWIEQEREYYIERDELEDRDDIKVYSMRVHKGRIMELLDPERANEQP